MVARVNFKNIPKYIFLLIVAVYAFGLTQFGFETWDTGYIPGYSWRIVNGETVYSDFVYKGPPLTLYFHAFFMMMLPEFGQFLLLKSLTMMMFGLQVYFVVSGIEKIYNLRSIGVNKWILMFVGFVISILDFPGYPWPTTDGLLFASAAFYLVASSYQITTARLVFIALFCLMSALTKQSFYPVPILFGAWILLEFGLKKFGVYLMSLLFWIAVFVMILGGNVAKFIAQTTGETHLDDLVYVGFHNYKSALLQFGAAVGIALGVALFGILKFDRSRNNIENFARWLPFTIGIFALFTAFTDVYESSRIIFAANVVAIVLGLIFQKQKLSYYLPFLTLIGIAWCASISLGYQYPVFYLSALIACFAVLCHEELASLLTIRFYWIPALLLFFIGLSHPWQPYREKPIPELGKSLSEISPKLAFIRTNTENYDKLAELKKLTDEYPNFIVAPSLPMAYYLFDSRNPLPADWLINTEVDRKYEYFVTLASDDKYFVLLEKSFLQNESSIDSDLRSSIIAWKMYGQLRKVDETNHFLVLNGKR